MGIMQGKVYPNIMVITDVFSLPVEGTETRVNAANEANEYMIDYLTRIKEVGRLENAIGWYHSHPGYGCWLSGIDVSTQTMNQTFQDPFLAIVVDPIRTLSTGKVELGAFRTFPENYTPSESFKSEDTNIPLNKVEDFGVHHSKYYPVKVSYFKSHLDNYIIDQLWSKYWVETLTKSSLFVNRQYHTNQLADLGTKFQRLDSYSLFNDFSRFDSKPSNGKGPNATPVDKVAQSANLINNELSQGLMSQMIKSTLFPQKD
jgi:COP9 signalosome complex subunit 5